MPLHRRSALVLVGTALAAPLLPRLATPAFAQGAQPADPRMTERTMGSPNAKVTVQEWFSLTCTHCAAFAKETFPEVKTKLIDTGKIRWVFRDFPLDRVALMAAMVARALPPEQYEPFIMALFNSQDRWAFAQGVNSTEEVAKIAALAGMSRETFDKTINDQALQRFILNEQAEGEKKYSVDSTPTFIINGKAYPGERSFDSFAKAVAAASS